VIESALEDITRLSAIGIFRDTDISSTAQRNVSALNSRRLIERGEGWRQIPVVLDLCASRDDHGN
jgi:hypothetical protein